MMAYSSPLPGVSVGIVGMGDMGKMYARRISEAGWKVNACDLPSKRQDLETEFQNNKLVEILDDGHLVSRISDYIIYSVEAEKMDAVVGRFGPSTKLGAIVGGQTSCKGPEIEAFEKYLPDDVNIVPCHSMHGPGVNPRGQPLVLIKHRASDESFALVERILSCLGSRHVYLTAAQHDKITADTQAVTHAAFLSMGAAWAANKQFPWESARYIGGIENVKINVMMRIYSNKWHVYAALAITNPYAHEQIRQYAASVTDLFKLMLAGERQEFTRRIVLAGQKVFRDSDAADELLLEDDVLDRFSLGQMPPEGGRLKNNHLSLLAMVDCWAELGIVPYEHMICSTPLYRMWLGMAQYLFRKPQLLEECIETALNDNTFRADDLEFTFAARDWSERVSVGNTDRMEGYKTKFLKTQQYFASRFAEANKIGNEMIKTILENTAKR